MCQDRHSVTDKSKEEKEEPLLHIICTKKETDRGKDTSEGEKEETITHTKIYAKTESDSITDRIEEKKGRNNYKNDNICQDRDRARERYKQR